MSNRPRTATLAACAAALLAPAAASAITVPTPAAPTPTRAWVGEVAAEFNARAAPRIRARIVGRLTARTQHEHQNTPLVTASVVRKGVRWVQVLLPQRPNGSRGWVPANKFHAFRATAIRVVIDTGDRRLTVYRAGRSVMSVPVAVGKASTPTPHGRWFAIDEMLRTPEDTNFLGPIVLPLTGYSRVLNEFAGGNGRVAIHGTNAPALIGTNASNGCIRMYNADITRLARLARPGTPVTIRA